MTPGY